jgi:type I restriction enzyme S subunit
LEEARAAEAREVVTALKQRARDRGYPNYRDSGVEWLGEIPTHWKVKRLKYLALLNPESLAEDTDPAREMTYVDIGGVDSLGRIVERESLTFGSSPSRARRVVIDGDVIVSTVRTYLRAIAPIDNPEPTLVVSTGFAVVRAAGDLISDFAAYALRAPFFVERIVANSKGVSFPAINETEMATYELAVPPEPEQRAIATFLDCETARIDALVAKKERLIELLQEKRAALITRAVTKGLDLTVPMKNSGIEWLDEIPADWEVVRIGRKITLQRGVDITKDEQNEGQVPVVSSGGASSFHDRALACGPGVVVGRKGTAGSVYYVEEDYWPHDTTLWVRDFRGNSPRFVFYKLGAMDLARFDTGSANPTLNRNLEFIQYSYHGRRLTLRTPLRPA